MVNPLYALAITKMNPKDCQPEPRRSPQRRVNKKLKYFYLPEKNNLKGWEMSRLLELATSV
jgi:hypothetical protein